MAEEAALKEHIELQSKTIEEQSSTMKKLDETNKKLVADMTALKAEKPPANEGGAVELKKQLDAALATNAEHTAEKEQAQLTKEFPKIKDWTAVTGKDFAEKKANAEKISKMIPDPKPKLDKDGKPIIEDKGAKFKDAPPAGAPNVEALGKEEFDKKKTELVDLMKKGDVSGVIGKCFELQPQASKSLFNG